MKNKLNKKEELQKLEAKNIKKFIKLIKMKIFQ